MSLLSRLSTRLLGEPMPLPPDLAAGEIPAGVRVLKGTLIPRLGGFFAGMGAAASAVTLGSTIVVHPRRTAHRVAADPRTGACEAVAGGPALPAPLHRRDPAARVPRQPLRGGRARCGARLDPSVFHRGSIVTERSVVTIERHIMEAERQFPEATGAFSNILYDVALAAKMISREVRRAGLVDILGHTGTQQRARRAGEEAGRLRA